MTNEHLFLELALQQIGAPYIWGGKGTHLFDPVKGLVGSPFLGSEYGRAQLMVFDCSGLITYCMMKVTGLDQRPRWAAQTMHDDLPPWQPGVGPNPAVKEPHHAHLRLYGSGPQHISHVSIGLGIVDGKWLIIEATGGDRTTTSVVEAQKRGASVRCGFERRVDVQSLRVIPV